MGVKPFWRDIRFLQILAQIIFVLVLFVVAGLLYSNVTINLQRQGLTVGYGFLKNPASFDIGESFIPYSAQDTYAKALVVGIVNTLVVFFIGIIFATLLGVLAGIARLSNNYLIRQISAGYIALIRNTPLIIQLMFWYFGIATQLPSVREAANRAGFIYLTNRGLYLPAFTRTAAFYAWQNYLWAAVLSIFAIWLILLLVNKVWKIKVPRWVNIAYVIIPAAILAAGAAQLPDLPFALDLPELKGLNFKGGYRITPELGALLFGLVVYTGAFIAEIVRAGIQSVSKGQTEAARSLGLTSGQTLRLIVLPQALRVIIPPLTSQYLNLAKNSSLAIAIGYPDLFSIAGTIFNQTGAAIEIITILMLSYLIVSLITSFFMNIYNARTKLVER